MSFTFEPIGIIHSCFKEKFGIPRQSGLIPEAEGQLEILPPYNRPEAFVELQSYSHLWISFIFHQAMRDAWRPSVRPPRLGGNRRVGVFASRSPFRPNPLGLSVVELQGVEQQGEQIVLQLGGIDLLDGTPVIDIKPYVPYCDAIPGARSGFAPEPPGAPIELTFAPQAEATLAQLPPQQAEQLRRLIQRILEIDPRPAYHRNSVKRRDYGMRLYDFNIRWRVDAETVTLTRIEAFQEEPV